MITIPNTPKKTSGMTFSRNRWWARWYENGRMRIKSLGTTDLDEAIPRRDALFQSLKDNGANVSKKPPGPLPNSGIYGIHVRKPYMVVLKGRRVGEYDTLEEAVEAKDNYCHEMPEMPKQARRE